MKTMVVMMIMIGHEDRSGDFHHHDRAGIASFSWCGKSMMWWCTDCIDRAEVGRAGKHAMFEDVFKTGGPPVVGPRYFFLRCKPWGMKCSTPSLSPPPPPPHRLASTGYIHRLSTS